VNTAQNISAPLQLASRKGATRVVAFVYQRMLPYHQDRFAAASARLRSLGYSAHAIEVADFDGSYGDIGIRGRSRPADVTCLFPGSDYLKLSPAQVVRAVEERLSTLQPETIFAPAAAFAEGAACLRYRSSHASRLILMDDAWAATDHRGWLRTAVKRFLYRLYDGAFVPAQLHGRYYQTLGIPTERQRFGVSAVGPFVVDATSTVALMNLPPSFLLCVSRLIGRKGIDDLLQTVAEIRAERPNVCLMIVGGGPEGPALQLISGELGLQENVVWLGRLKNADSRWLMSRAAALIVPSFSDQWGLVVNEGWLAKTPVIGSKTVGAVAAAYDASLQGLAFTPGNRAELAACIRGVLKLKPESRNALVRRGQECMAPFSLQSHVESVLELVGLPARPQAGFLLKRIASFWKGRVVVF
jgi:glycosyltransferase involved in cell wall biosynthesis